MNFRSDYSVELLVSNMIGRIIIEFTFYLCMFLY